MRYRGSLFVETAGITKLLVTLPRWQSRCMIAIFCNKIAFDGLIPKIIPCACTVKKEKTVTFLLSAGFNCSCFKGTRIRYIFRCGHAKYCSPLFSPHPVRPPVAMFGCFFVCFFSVFVLVFFKHDQYNRNAL